MSDRLTTEEVQNWVAECESVGIEQDIAKQLIDVMRENERLHNVICNLEPLRDIDWHGKWRIHACLDALSNKHPENMESIREAAGREWLEKQSSQNIDVYKRREMAARIVEWSGKEVNGVTVGRVMEFLRDYPSQNPLYEGSQGACDPNDSSNGSQGWRKPY